MLVGFLLEFLIASFFVFILSGLVLMLTIRSPSSGPAAQVPGEDNIDHPSEGDALEHLAEAIREDASLLAPPPPVEVPHIDLPTAILGGGAADEACSKTTGTLILKLIKDPNEKRKYNRRMSNRRVSDISVSEEKRMVQRRVWLRREEDRRGQQLLNVSDAADTLGVPVEQIYRWLDETDIPFYQVTEGKKKAIRFEINELLQWHSVFASSGSDPGSHH